MPPSAIARIDQVPTRREMSVFIRQPAGKSRVSATSAPPRRTTAGIRPDSGARCKAQATSATEIGGWPSRDTMSSPAWKPARAAGESPATAVTRAG